LLSSGIAEVNEPDRRDFKLANPEKFSRDLATRINQLMKDRQLREKFGRADRKRAEEHFSWTKIAAKTKALYETLL
jgi:glycosyltransferase involved in cell wall biosynthesis